MLLMSSIRPRVVPAKNPICTGVACFVCRAEYAVIDFIEEVAKSAVYKKIAVDE